MKDLAPYAIVALVCLALGALLMKQCSTPKVAETVRTDTLRVTEWAYVTQWKTKTVTKRDTLRIPFAITDSVLCCEQLTDCADQLWSLANFEAEAEQALEGGGMARVSFSMPLYRESPEHAFKAMITRPDTNRTEYIDRYREETVWDRIILSAGIGYGVGPLGIGPSANIQAGYRIVKLSDLWR